MRRSLLAAAASLGLVGMAGLPAYAANTTPATNASSTSNASGTSNTSSTANQLVDGATKAVKDLKSDPHYADLLKRAKGVFIVPTMVKGALGVGANGGQGVLLKRSGGHWSDPAFLTVGTISLGPQAGGSAGETVMLLMTDKALGDFSQANNFSLGANAGLTVIGYSAKGQAPVGKGDVVIWSNQSGAFAGASVSATDITSNTQEDHGFYGKSVTTADILNGKVTRESDASSLISALAS